MQMENNVLKRLMENMPKSIQLSVVLVFKISILILNRNHITVSDYTDIDPQTLIESVRIIYIVEMWAYLGLKALLELVLIIAIIMNIVLMFFEVRKNV